MEGSNPIFEGDLSGVLTNDIPDNLVKGYGENGAYILATLKQMAEENKINNSNSYDFQDFLLAIGVGEGLDVVNHLNVVIAGDDMSGQNFFGMKSDDYEWTATSECDNFHNIYYNYCITHGQSPEEFISNYMMRLRAIEERALTVFLKKVTDETEVLNQNKHR